MCAPTVTRSSALLALCEPPQSLVCPGAVCGAQVVGVLVCERQGFEFGDEVEAQALRVMAARVAAAAQRCLGAQLPVVQQAQGAPATRHQGMEVTLRAQPEGQGAGQGAGLGSESVQAGFRVLDG